VAATECSPFKSVFPLPPLKLPLLLPETAGQGTLGKGSQKGNCQHFQRGSLTADKLLYLLGVGAEK